jgi:hypothetical protein
MSFGTLIKAGVVCVVLAGAAGAAQVTNVWINPGNGAWGTAGNWSQGAFPNNGGGTTYKVVVDGNTANNVAVTATGTFTVDELVIDLSDQVIVANNSSLTLASGSIANAGTLSLSAGVNLTDLKIDAANLNLSGGGILSLGNSNNNRILGSVATNRLTNVDNVIRGSGQIGINQMALTNEAGGVIEANQSTTLTIDPSSSGAINQGILRATNNATLALSSGTFTNTGGTIEAQNGSTVQLSGATVVGGTLTTAGSGVIKNIGSATLNGVTNAGAFAQNNNTDTTVIGTINNTGSIALNSSSHLTDLTLSGDVTLTGGGTVNLTNFANNRILGAAAGNRLTNVDNVIQGSGQIGVNLMALTNEAGGVIEANQSTTLTIDPSSSGAINQGILRATNNATLVLSSGTFTNTGATIEAQNGSTVQLSGATVVGGTLTTAGSGVIKNTGGSTLNGVTNAGAFAQNNNTDTTVIGTINNTGSIALNSSSHLTDLILSGDVTLTGGGTVNFTNFVNNRIYGAAAANRLTNVDNVIQGSGQIGVNQMAFTNQGTVSATSSAGLSIDPSASGAINTGVMQALGGPVTLENGTFTNTGGIIRSNSGTVNVNSATVNGGNVEVLGAGMISMSGGTITGGTLDNSSTGIIRSTSGANTLGGTVNNVAGGQIVLNNNTSLTLQGSGVYNNAGTIAMNSTGNLTDLIMDGDVTLSGGGTVSLTNLSNNRMYGQAGTERLTNVNNTISGSGQLGINLMAITNQAGGVIEANQTISLTIDPNASGVINQGILRATNNATLVLSSGTYTNTGGTIEAQNGSTVQANGVTIAGGTLTTSGSGVIKNTGSLTLNGVTNAGAFAANNNTTTTLVGTITNSGSMALNSSGNLTDVQISGDVALTGGGILNLTNSTNNRIFGVASTNRLTNVDNTIRGSGQIGVNLMRFTNQGTVLADQSTALTIDSSSGFTNSGILQALAGATLSVVGTGVDFSNFAGTTLTGGSYFVGSGNATTATLQFDNANIVTNQATIDLNGSGARILNRLNSANGISNLTTNGAQGDFTIRNGKNLSTNAAFLNQGAVTVGDSSTLTIGTGTGVFTNSGLLDGTGTIVGTVINSGNVNPGSSPGTLTVNGTYNQAAGGSLNIEIASLSSFDRLIVLGQALLDGNLNISLLGGYVPNVGDIFEFMQFSSLVGDFSHFSGLNIGGGLSFREVITANGISLVVDSNVPEPATWLMLGAGLAAVAAFRRRRMRA